MSTYALRPLQGRDHTPSLLVLQSLERPCGNYDTGMAGEWLWRGRGGRRFVADGGVGLYVAPVPGKGYGLFTVGSHAAGTTIGYVQGRIIAVAEAGQPGKDYVDIRKANRVFVCETPTIEEPAWFANTATAREENNARFVVNPRTHEVRVELTAAVGAFQEVLVDYGEEYRTELRQLTRANKRQRESSCTGSLDFDSSAVCAADMERYEGREARTAAEAIAAWKTAPTRRLRCPACSKMFYRKKGRAHVLNCQAKSSPETLGSTNPSATS